MLRSSSKCCRRGGLLATPNQRPAILLAMAGSLLGLADPYRAKRE